MRPGSGAAAYSEAGRRRSATTSGALGDEGASWMVSGGYAMVASAAVASTSTARHTRAGMEGKWARSPFRAPETEAFRTNVLRKNLVVGRLLGAVRQAWCVARSAISGVGCGGTLSVPQSTDEDDFKAQVDALKARQEVRPILRAPALPPSLRSPMRSPSAARPGHQACRCIVGASCAPPARPAHPPSLRRARRVATVPSAGTPPAPTAPSSRIPPPTHRPRPRRATARPSPRPSAPPTPTTRRRRALLRRGRAVAW